MSDNPREPTLADLVPGFEAFIAGLAAHLQEHAPEFVAEVARLTAEQQASTPEGGAPQ